MIGLDKISISCQNLNGMQSIIVAKGWSVGHICNPKPIFFPWHPKLAVICRLIDGEAEVRDTVMALVDMNSGVGKSRRKAHSPGTKHDADNYGLKREDANERHGAGWWVSLRATFQQDQRRPTSVHFRSLVSRSHAVVRTYPTVDGSNERRSLTASISTEEIRWFLYAANHQPVIGFWRLSIRKINISTFLEQKLVGAR